MTSLEINILRLRPVTHDLVWDDEYNCEVLRPKTVVAFLNYNEPDQFKEWMRLFCPNAILGSKDVHSNITICFNDMKELAILKLTWGGAQ